MLIVTSRSIGYFVPNFETLDTNISMLPFTFDYKLLSFKLSVYLDTILTR